MSSELKPCPFCGDVAKYAVEDGVWHQHHTIICSSIPGPGRFDTSRRCPGAPCKPMWYRTKQAAIAAWNTRKEDSHG
jgi:hypothetical protein